MAIFIVCFTIVVSILFLITSVIPYISINSNSSDVAFSLAICNASSFFNKEKNNNVDIQRLSLEVTNKEITGITLEEIRKRSSLNFIVTVMMGCFAGQVLCLGERAANARKAWILACIGAALIVAGLLMSPLWVFNKMLKIKTRKIIIEI